MNDIFDWIFTALHLAVPATFVALAGLVLRSRNKTAAAWLWVMVCGCAAALWISIYLVTRGFLADGGALTATRIAFTFGVLGCMATLFFSCATIGVLHRCRGPVLISILLGLAFMAMFWATDLLVAGLEPYGYGLVMPLAGPLMPLYLAYVVVHLGLPLPLVFRAFLRASGRERLRLAYVLAAFVVIALGAGGTLLPTWYEGSLAALAPIPFMIVAPVLITYAIIRHQLWDIRTVIHRTILWLVTSLIGLLPILLILRFWLEATAEFAVPAAVAIFAWAVLHFRVIQPWIDHRFSRGRYDRARIIGKLSHDVLNLRGVRKLAGLLAETVLGALYPSFVRLTIPSANGEVLRVLELRAGRVTESNETGSPWLSIDTATLADTSVIDLFAPDEQGFGPGDAQALRDIGVSKAALLALPLVHESRLIAIVELGERESLRAYTREDFILLDDIRASATVAMANALLYDEIQELAGTLERRVETRTRELKEANERLVELDRAKSRLFSSISHELKTPLTLILAPIEDRLAAGELEPREKEELRMVHRNALRLLRQINAFLDLAKIDAGEMKLRVDDLDLHEIASRSVQSFEAVAKRKKIALELHGEPGSARAIGDPDRLELVTNNLLANALKFTPADGSVRVEVGGREGEAFVAVSDTGIGIAPDELDQIFDRFVQADAGEERRFEGAGIGLALVKEVAELHGGRALVESSEGAGSRFEVVLPSGERRISDETVDRRRVDLPSPHRRRIEDADPFATDAFAMDGSAWVSVDETEPEAAARPDGPRPRRRERILIVEDNPDMREYLASRLGAIFTVCPCRDAAEALDRIEDFGPSLIVLDVMMPGMSGYELCRRLRADERTRAVPIIMLTIWRGTERVIEGFTAGADDYVGKPFNMSELLARIDVQLRLVEMGRRLAMTEKAGVMNLMAAALAHEVRNPVNAILNALDPLAEISLRAEDGSRAAARELFLAIRDSAERIEMLCSDLLDVSRANQGGIGVWELDSSLDSTTRLLNYRHGREIALERRLGHHRPPVGNVAALNQVLLNLLDNAAKACGPQGAITVETFEKNGIFTLVVSDDGPGIQRGMEEKIFDPFFKSRTDGSGSGLGLYIVRKLAEEHGGTVSAHARPKRGLELVVNLPIMHEGVAG